MTDIILAPAELKQVPLKHVHENLGAKMVPFAGFYMPVRYSSDMEEHHAVRNSVGVFDVSHMGEFVFSGPKALALLQNITTNDVSALTIGKAQYSCFPNGKGGIVDDVIVYRTDREEYLVVVNASNIEKDWNWVVEQNSIGATIQNLSDKFCLFAVQGPKAVDTLNKISESNLAEIPYYHFRKANIGGVERVMVSNTGYTGAGGFELMVRVREAEKLWDAVFAAGEEFGIRPIGLGARDTLRLEMGFCLYGNDIDDTTSPIEVGLGWITKFSKEFIDKEFLQNQKENGVDKKLVGFEMVDRGIARSHYEITDAERRIIGSVTSGTQSPTLGKAIGLGYVDIAYAIPDTEIYIQIRNNPFKAKIVKLPFLKNK